MKNRDAFDPEVGSAKAGERLLGSHLAAQIAELRPLPELRRLAAKAGA